MAQMRTWDPFRELDILRREVDRMMESLAGNGGSSPFSRFSFLPGRAARMYPLVNIREDADNVYLEGLAPGLNPESLAITVVQGTLRLEGEKQALSEDIRPESYHRNERSAGRFVRSISLPTEVEGDNVKAEYKNGLLNITLPKSEKAKPKRININVQ